MVALCGKLVAMVSGSFGCEASTPKYMPLFPRCIILRNLLVLNQTVNIRIGIPKTWERWAPPLGMGNVADLRGRRFPHTCYHANFGALDQTICAYVGDPEKNWERLGRLLGGTTAPQNMPLHDMGYDSEFD